MHFPRRRYTCPVSLEQRQAKYLNFDFPIWTKYLPFERLWQENHLDLNIRQMLAETEAVLEKAKLAGLTLEGYRESMEHSFTAKEWCLWLIQGKKEIAVNTLKRNYFEVMKARGLKTDPEIRIKNVALDRQMIAYITTRIELICT